MANIRFRAYASLTPAQLVPAVFERAYQIAILDLTARELHKTLSANDIDNLEQRLINPLRTHYANPANDTAHFHLPPNIFIETVTVIQWQLLRAARKSSYPMFNVYDLLEVAYTNLTKNYGFLPMRLRPNKTIDKPILFNQIPKQAQEDLGPQNIVQILESLRNCCNAFSAPRNGKKPRTQSMPSIAGYSMPTVSTAARPMYPSFGVVTAGNPAQKAELIAARLARFSQAIQNTIQAGNWVCGNCAEQAYWPVPGDEQTEYEGITIVIRDFQGEDTIAPGRSAGKCPNCKVMAAQMATEGFVMKESAALGRPPIGPAAVQKTVKI